MNSTGNYTGDILIKLVLQSLEQLFSLSLGWRGVTLSKFTVSLLNVPQYEKKNVDKS